MVCLPVNRPNTALKWQLSPLAGLAKKTFLNWSSKTPLVARATATLHPFKHMWLKALLWNYDKPDQDRNLQSDQHAGAVASDTGCPSGAGHHPWSWSPVRNPRSKSNMHAQSLVWGFHQSWSDLKCLQIYGVASAQYCLCLAPCRPTTPTLYTNGKQRWAMLWSWL